MGALNILSEYTNTNTEIIADRLKHKIPNTFCYLKINWFPSCLFYFPPVFAYLSPMVWSEAIDGIVRRKKSCKANVLKKILYRIVI